MPFDPKTVGEEADRMIAELSKGAQPEAASDVAEEPDVQTDAVAADEGASEATDGVDTQQAVETTAESAVEPSAESKAIEELRKQLEAAENRWRSLQGMIDRKDEELTNMRMLFAQLQATPAEKSERDEGKPLVSADELKQYDSELIDVVSRLATDIANKVVRNELSKFKPTIDQVEQAATAAKKSAEELAYDRFIESLSDAVEDWEQINVDPGFIAWLNNVDEFTGATRLALLHDAFSKLNAKRVAKFFLAYKAETMPQQKEQQPQASAPAQSAEVKKFVTPAKSKATPASTNTQSSRVWTRADIAKLYDDRMKGKISQAEFDKLERDLFKAQSENRIAA